MTLFLFTINLLLCDISNTLRNTLKEPRLLKAPCYCCSCGGWKWLEAYAFSWLWSVFASCRRWSASSKLQRFPSSACAMIATTWRSGRWPTTALTCASRGREWNRSRCTHTHWLFTLIYEFLTLTQPLQPRSWPFRAVSNCLFSADCFLCLFVLKKKMAHSSNFWIWWG